MKGIILAGGVGTRLYPSTITVSKQLLSVYDKPMIYYPLSTLMLSGISDILVITTPHDQPLFIKQLGNGSNFGINLTYKTQEYPRGLAEAFIIGEEFIADDTVALILGDNIFYGYGFSGRLTSTTKNVTGAVIFGYHVSNPQDFGVVSFDSRGNVTTIEEKPKCPKSNYAIPGLYFYNNHVVEYAKQVKPSQRGELEITAINQIYLDRNELKVELLGRGMAWMDTGNHRALLSAANFVEAVQTQQGLYIACLEEIAFRNGWIDRNSLLKQAQRQKATEYGQYLFKIADALV